jgi:hypothetical protein
MEGVLVGVLHPERPLPGGVQDLTVNTSGANT